jgi:hypothetical protein
MEDKDDSTPTLFTYPILFKFRSIPQLGTCGVTLTGAHSYSRFSLCGNTRSTPGLGISLPLSTDQLPLMSFILQERSMTFTVGGAVTMLDISLYVSVQEPLFRGYVSLPRGTDVMIVTPWDRLDVIGDSMWTANCVDPDVPAPAAGSTDEDRVTSMPRQPVWQLAQDGSLPPPAAAQMTIEVAAHAPQTQERI